MAYIDTTLRSSLSSITTGSTVTALSTDSWPTTNNDVGDTLFVLDTNQMYVWAGASSQWVPVSPAATFPLARPASSIIHYALTATPSTDAAETVTAPVNALVGQAAVELQVRLSPPTTALGANVIYIGVSEEDSALTSIDNDITNAKTANAVATGSRDGTDVYTQVYILDANTPGGVLTIPASAVGTIKEFAVKSDHATTSWGVTVGVRS